MNLTQIDVVTQLLQQRLFYLMNNYQDCQYPLVNYFNNEHVHYKNTLPAGKRSFNDFASQKTSDNSAKLINCEPIKMLNSSQNYPKSETTDMTEDESEAKTQLFYDHLLLKKIPEQGINSSFNTSASTPERKIEEISNKVNKPVILRLDESARVTKKNYIESEHEQFNVKEDYDTDTSSPNKEQKNKSAQSRWKNFPGHILIGIKNISQSYSQRLDKLKLKCTDEILDQLSEETKYRLYKFMKEYDYKFKTYSGIKKLLRDGQYDDVTEVIIKIVDALLSDKNANDFEKWLKETRMADKSKDLIRQNKETLRKNFIKQISLEN